MARKPGSWKKINKLTKTVSVASRRKALVAGICASIYFLALIPTGYFAVKFLENVLSYGGIETDGPLPEVGSGEYFQINFAQAPMRDNTIKTKKFGLSEVPADPNNGQVVPKMQAEATSIRLEYAYNEIFNNAPSQYIANNFFYKGQYSDPKQIEILDIYTDSAANTALSLKDVQTNKLNLMTNMLYLKIKYKNVLQSALVMMPTLFIGQEGFLSNFLTFKSGETMNKDQTNPVIWNNQTKILGDQANNIMISGSTNTNDFTLDDMIYEAYSKKFELFYENNKGDDKEFIGNTNPYNNFVISSVNPQDAWAGGILKFDSTQYMFDMNAAINSSSSNSSPIISRRASSTEISISEKYVPQLLVFLLNVLATSKNPTLALPSNVIPTAWKTWYNLITPKKIDVNNPEQFYFMFLPEGETLQNIIGNHLESQVSEVLDGKLSFTEAIKDLQNDILTNPTNSDYQWVFNWNILPFQTYAAIEKADYNVIKRTVQENKNLVIGFGQPPQPGTEFITIDQPSTHSIGNLATISANDDSYTIDDPQKRNSLFTNYWSANLYNASNALNQINLDLNNLPATEDAFKTAIVNQFVDQTWSFINNISTIAKGKYEILNGVDKTTYSSYFDAAAPNKQYTSVLNPLDANHKGGFVFADWYNALVNNDLDTYSKYTAIDIQLTNVNNTSMPENLKSITFRFNVNYN